MQRYKLNRKCISNVAQNLGGNVLKESAIFSTFTNSKNCSAIL